MSKVQLPAFATKLVSTTRKYSPEILTTAGVVGTVGTVVLACRATLKVSDVLDEFRQAREDISQLYKISKTDPEFDRKYSEQDMKRDVAVVYARAGIGLFKLYSPAVALGVASVAALIGSHRILRGRNVALAAAYKALDTNFSKYRNRVVAKFGEEAEAKLREMTFEEVEEENEEGEKVKTVKVDPNSVSEYARYFDEMSHSWSNDPTQNLMFLRHKQNYFNDILQIRGHVFLNEVYDALGMPRSRAGAVVGWCLDSEDTDGYIDFGIYDSGNGDIAARRRDFVNGYNKSILLDFNVDGVIYDLI